MIEEQGVVVAVEKGAVWVETRRASACSGCAARSGCGQGLMDRLGVSERRGLIRANCEQPVELGDAVVIGIGEAVVLRAALWVYLVPLLGLFVAGVASYGLGLAESWVILCALAGFLFGGLLARRHGGLDATECAGQPVVLRTLLAGSAALR